MVKKSKQVKILVLLIIATAGLVYQFTNVMAADFIPILKVSTDDVYIIAGQENQIKITLTNIGSWNIYEVKVTLSVPSTTPGISIIEESNKVFNKIEEDESKNFYPVIFVDEDTPLGSYTLTLQGTYMKKVQFGASNLESMTLQIGIVVIREHVGMSVNPENPFIAAGVDNQINVKLTNIGDFTMNDIYATLTSISPYLTILEGSYFTHTELELNHSAMHHSRLWVSRDTPIGVYALTETIVYQDEEGKTFAESYEVLVNVQTVSRPNPILNIKIDDPHLTAGAENEVNVTLDNIGDEKIYSIELSFTSTTPYIVILEGTKITYDNLDVEEKTVHEAVIAVSKNAPVGVYSLTSLVSYRGSDGHDHVDTIILGLNVDTVNRPDQTTVVLKDYNTSIKPIQPGDEFELILDFECLGAKAHEVMVAITVDQMTGISTMSPTTVDVGTLLPNQKFMVPFELLIGGNVKAGQYPTIITVTYIDADGIPLSLLETVTLSVRGIIEFNLLNIEPLITSIGTSTELEADLLIIGTESVQFVTIEIIEDFVFKRTIDSEEYIGAVDPDSPIPFDLMFEVDGGTKTGEHTLNLKVTYTDDLYKVHEEILKLTMKLREASEITNQTASTGGFWAWIRRLLGLGP
jgi:hypothetical protein